MPMETFSSITPNQERKSFTQSRKEIKLWQLITIQPDLNFVQQEKTISLKFMT